MSLRAQAEAAITEITGQPPVSVRQVSSGDAAAGAFVAQLPDGTPVFAKASRLERAAQAEAASLTWLAEPGALAVPRVHGHDDHWLVIDFIEPGAPTPQAAEEFGRGLARLHAAGAPHYGAAPPGGPEEAWIGLAPMRNVPCESWPEFYATHRVEPYLQRAVDSGVLGPQDGKVIRSVCERLDELAGPAEPPARLHGDLWSGNVHWGDGVAWAIDPAAHGGHRETDLAMLQLFGCPHLDRILAAYQEVSPLAEGWRQRVGLHQLFPLLVHAVLFGGGYAGQALAAARSALRAAG